MKRNKEILRDLESLSLHDSLLCKNFLILSPPLASLKSSTMGPTRVVQGAGRPPLGMPCYIEASPLTCLTPSFLILFPCFSQIQISNLNFKFSIKNIERNLKFLQLLQVDPTMHGKSRCGHGGSHVESSSIFFLFSWIFS